MPVQEIPARFGQQLQRRVLTELVLEPLREEQYNDVESEFMSTFHLFLAVVFMGFEGTFG